VRAERKGATRTDSDRHAMNVATPAGHAEEWERPGIGSARRGRAIRDARRVFCADRRRPGCSAIHPKGTMSTAPTFSKSLLRAETVGCPSEGTPTGVAGGDVVTVRSTVEPDRW
jgi:hypothetical protein